MSSQAIYILITADYELFLGRNFVSNDEVLFKPTEQLLKVCRELEVPITFFADVCSVWAHRKYDLEEYCRSFESQMTEALDTGHDVQLHLHPHWLESSYSGGEWQISTERMYLSEFGFGSGEDEAPAVIGRGIEYLNDLLLPKEPSYRCLAFRAAGLALQPDEHRLIESLIENGITIDTSVARGLRLTMDTVRIDYTGLPSAANWFMNSDSGISGEAPDGLFEIPIATFRCSPLSRIGFLWRRARSVGMRRGAGISRSARQTKWSNLKTMLLYNLRYVYTNPYFSLSCDTKGYNSRMLIDGLDRYIRQHQNDNEIFASMINHPKLMFEPQLNLLKEFVTESRNRYGARIKFITCSQASEIRSQSS